MKPAQAVRVHEWCDAQTTGKQHRSRANAFVTGAVHASDAPREAKPLVSTASPAVHKPGQRSYIAIIARACTIDDQGIADAAKGKQRVVPP